MGNQTENKSQKKTRIRREKQIQKRMKKTRLRMRRRRGSVERKADHFLIYFPSFFVLFQGQGTEADPYKVQKSPTSSQRARGNTSMGD